jgi:hypothetical protein
MQTSEPSLPVTSIVHIETEIKQSFISIQSIYELDMSSVRVLTVQYQLA